LLSSWDFKLVLTLIFLQNILTVLVVAMVQPRVMSADRDRGRGGGSVPRSHWATEFDFPLWDAGVALAMLPVMLMCVANLWAGMSALSLSSVPVYQTLKRMTPLPAMALDCLLRGKTFSSSVCASVLVVCVGAFLTGCGDLDLNARGYAFACASCVLQALYLVLASRAADTRAEITSLCAAYYNALLSLPLLTIGVCFEGRELLAFPSWRDPAFLGMLVLDLALGASLSLLLFMCTLTNSALTTTIVGNAKAVVTTVLGSVLFGRVGLRPLGWLGVVVNTGGGVLYTLAKYRERHARTRR
jgi:solute carrier family 35 protein